MDAKTLIVEGIKGFAIFASLAIIWFTLAMIFDPMFH